LNGTLNQPLELFNNNLIFGKRLWLKCKSLRKNMKLLFNHLRKRFKTLILPALRAGKINVMSIGAVAQLGPQQTGPQESDVYGPVVSKFVPQAPQYRPN
jgi:hypothetical protein